MNQLESSCLITDHLLQIVILETQLQKNTGVTQELFMEGYKIAVERNEGAPPESLPDYSFRDSG